ncbi:hypothetical protein LZD49_28700 [Dyadobacter sp. CY261]|uniref:hypothetical protein n=1 Tax=Dyadobacter sp. CY261 TaxID=2907203 RepID=UPI001F20C8F4|nr:hypothetical protein [Dyadobacter sp. CY261]MCF0074499.1 hypothetical protein [Dyadobacter sp. CY261]
MIYVADISSIYVQHEQFNKSFIELLRQNNPGTPIAFFAEKNHGKVILSRSAPGIESNAIYVYDKRGGLREFIRAYYQFKALLGVIRSAKGRTVTQIYVLLIHPFAHFLLKKFAPTDQKISVVMHGELESLKFNKHFLNKIWGWFLLKALTTQRPNLSYIILGKSIYDNLLKVLPSFTDQNTIILDHPYPFSRRPEKFSPNETITFSSLGVASIFKNSQYLFMAALKASQLGLTQKCKFIVGGRVYKNMVPYLNDFVNYKKDFGSYSRKELETVVSNSDYCVFYYDNRDYSMCSSGAFWDAINMEIPLLYVRNDYFDHYVTITGEIGRAFDTAEELNEHIISLIERGDSYFDDQYRRFTDNIRKLKYHYMSPANLTQQLNQTV